MMKTTSPVTKDDGSQSLAEWAAENMVYATVYGNYSGGGPVEYVGEADTFEGAERGAAAKRRAGWDFAYAVDLRTLHA